MTLRLHISAHNDDLHITTAKKNLANGVAGLDSNSKLLNALIPGILNKYSISNDILHLHDAEINGLTYTSYTKVKTITINSLHKTPETLRISFDLKRDIYSGTYWAVNARIYKNGVEHGGYFTHNQLNYVTKTVDLNFADGDTIELWVKCNVSAYKMSVRNFRVLGVSIQKNLDESIEESDIGLSIPMTGTNS